ncbi:hypothetical protein L195_g012355 [Trifolium pratense]|uniref:Uncharacterized protein n=1 Tax=Trifolium pratense TaxID=57577 RepID=A0A2K3PK65_TRIPR|nr:hypothetical protein L195_g012355 [Trifolium pratense]
MQQRFKIDEKSNLREVDAIDVEDLSVDFEFDCKEDDVGQTLPKIQMFAKNRVSSEKGMDSKVNVLSHLDGSYPF